MDSENYKGDKSQDFIEDVKSLCEQYGYKLINIKVKENERTKMVEEPTH